MTTPLPLPSSPNEHGTSDLQALIRTRNRELTHARDHIDERELERSRVSKSLENSRKLQHHLDSDMFTSRTYVESRSGTTNEELLKQLRALHVYARTDADLSRTKATIQKSITDTENKYQRLNQELEEWYAEEERLQSEINSYEAELAHREALATERNAQLIAAQNDRAAIDREVQRLVQARDNQICAGAVVAMLVTLAIIIAIALSETGNGPPNRGKEFTDSNAQLRNDALAQLRSARPSYSSWSGFRGAADDYDAKVREQQTWLSVLAAADQQTADAVTVQADQVEQARWALGAILAFLAGTIAVAVIWLARCETEKATASPAAPADEAALIMFGTGVALAVTAAAIAVLIVQDDAAKHTRRSLDSVRDTYQQIVAQVAATLPTG